MTNTMQRAHIGTLAHVAIRATSLPATIAFYTHVLGMKQVPRPPFNFEGAWLGNERGDALIHLYGGERARGADGRVPVGSAAVAAQRALAAVKMDQRVALFVAEPRPFEIERWTRHLLQAEHMCIERNRCRQAGRANGNVRKRTDLCARCRVRHRVGPPCGEGRSSQNGVSVTHCGPLFAPPTRSTPGLVPAAESPIAVPLPSSK